MVPFHEASYRAQVLRLRALAFEALKRFPVRYETLEFIHYGENATFKVLGRGRRAWLLRIHRPDYHSLPALHDELAWLKHLADRLPVQRPVASRAGRLIEQVETPRSGGARNCDLLEWVDGRMLSKTIKPSHTREIGRTLALLQRDARKRTMKHRQYWDAEGLLGARAKFGTVLGAAHVEKKALRKIESAARELRQEIARYRGGFGVIHADLHLGNCIFDKSGRLTPIDFDDCGHGYHLYDVCVPLVNLERLKAQDGRLRDSLIEGYAELAGWSARDDEWLAKFSVARRILMVGWLNARADHPRLKNHIPIAVENALKAISTLR